MMDISFAYILLGSVPDVALDVRGGDNAKILAKNFGGKNFAPQPLCSSPQKLKNLALMID